MTPIEEATGSPAHDPPSRLPVYYFTLAHGCLASALGALFLWPQSFAGFFYHPRMLAVVHLVTLGWITSSILGALYMIAPMALRTRLPVRRLDWWGFWLFAIGATGLVAHFWIEEDSGMVYAAALVLFVLALVGIRTARALRSAPIELGVKLHYYFAFANVLIAGGLGGLLGLNRLFPVVGGSVLTNLYAHAHMAALGWATMTLFGSAYRLLPMILPAAVPPARHLVTGALLLEVGALGLFISLLMGSATVALFAGVVACAVLWFLALVVWMLRHPRPPSRSLPRPDFARLHALQALVYLAITLGLGLVMALAPLSTWKLRLATAYAVCALLGFLGQMVLGVATRLFPVLVWMQAMARSGGPPTHSPYRLASPLVAAVELAAWSAGVPLLAVALTLETAPLIRAGAVLLLTAIFASSLNGARVLRSPLLRPSTIE